MLLLYLVQHFQSVPFPLAQSDSLRLHGALGHPWKRTFLLCTNRTFSFCGDRNLRKSFQAACVKVGLGVKTGPEDWQYKGLLIHDFREWRQKSDPVRGSTENRHEDFGASDRVYF